MATSLAPQTTNVDWADSDTIPTSDARATRALWLWTLFGLVLLVAFLAFVVDDFPLRTLIAAR
jgi:hypothetical protein